MAKTKENGHVIMHAAAQGGDVSWQEQIFHLRMSDKGKDVYGDYEIVAKDFYPYHIYSAAYLTVSDGFKVELYGDFEECSTLAQIIVDNGARLSITGNSNLTSAPRIIVGKGGTIDVSGSHELQLSQLTLKSNATFIFPMNSQHDFLDFPKLTTRNNDKKITLYYSTFQQLAYLAEELKLINTPGHSDKEIVANVGDYKDAVRFVIDNPFDISDIFDDDNFNLSKFNSFYQNNKYTIESLIGNNWFDNCAIL